MKYFFLMLFLSITTELLHAQDLLKGKDLSQVKVEQLSDAEIAKFKVQLNGAGISMEQAEQLALSKGMSVGEFAKLKQRISALPSTNIGNNTGRTKSAEPVTVTDSLAKETYEGKAARPLINPLIFGSELYTSVSPSFEPNMKLATPVNYIVGPDDQLQISVYGAQEYSGELKVSSEGSINIPNIGLVKVSGMTIEAATQKVRTIMGNSVYRTLSTGTSKLSVTLSDIRTIRVTVIGGNRPSNYNLSSLATVFTALYVAGGPSAFGSFRQIELWRNNQLIRKIDLYRLMMSGDQSDNVGLRDNDVIRIPAYTTRIEIQGQVKRPGIFEVLAGESFQDMLNFASGFTDTAYQASVKVFQRSDKERKVQDLEAPAYNSYKPRTGDVFVVSKILNRFQNRVTLKGAVSRPDVYQLTPNLTVSGLIRKADGLKEDAYTGRGQIIRLQEDLTRSILSFDVKKALAGDPANDLILQREDQITISSVLELRDIYEVTIQGEIRLPGRYDYVEHLTLKDLILQAGGFTDAAFKNIEIARLIKRDSISATDVRASTIIYTQVDGDLATSDAVNVELQPFDLVTIRRKAGYTLPESVTVSGMVQYPGPYVLNNRNERVSEILRRAGGYTSDAHLEGAYLRRPKTESEIMKIREDRRIARNLSKYAKDSALIADDDNEMIYDKIAIDLPKIINSPGSVQDLILRPKDELIIPKFDGQVKVSGAVLMVTQVPYQKEKTMEEYISEAGGYSGNAWRKKAYVIYANGRAATISRFLFFKSYPKILPGSTISVPMRPERSKASVAEIVGIGSALASLAGVVIAILKL